MAFNPSFVAGLDAKGAVKIIAAGQDVGEITATFKELRAAGFKGYTNVKLYIKPPESMHGKADPFAEVKPSKAIKV